jgi:hypothetical protein
MELDDELSKRQRSILCYISFKKLGEYSPFLSLRVDFENVDMGVFYREGKSWLKIWHLRSNGHRGPLTIHPHETVKGVFLWLRFRPIRVHFGKLIRLELCAVSLRIWEPTETVHGPIISPDPASSCTLEKVSFKRSFPLMT